MSSSKSKIKKKSSKKGDLNLGVVEDDETTIEQGPGTISSEKESGRSRKTKKSKLRKHLQPADENSQEKDMIGDEDIEIKEVGTEDSSSLEEQKQKKSKKKKKKSKMSKSKKKGENATPPDLSLDVYESAPVVTESETAAPMEEDDDSPPPLLLPADMPFEDLFYNEGVQRCAFEMFTKTNEVTVQERPGPKELRPSTVAASSASKKQENSTEQSNSSLASHNPYEEQMVNEIVKRLKMGRKMNRKPKPGSLSHQRALSDSDSDIDEDVLDSDSESELTGESNLMKYAVPQYELKQKLCEMHYGVIKSMSNSEIVQLCNDALPELNEIKNGKVFCQRHKIFTEMGLNKQRLRDMTVHEPFNSFQDHYVLTLIKDNLFKSDGDLFENNGESLHYIAMVMLPEALVRIFAKANGIDNSLAEKELRFKGGYDGVLSDDLINTIPKSVQSPQKKFKGKSKRFGST